MNTDSNFSMNCDRLTSKMVWIVTPWLQFLVWILEVESTVWIVKVWVYELCPVWIMTRTLFDDWLRFSIGLLKKSFWQLWFDEKKFRLCHVKRSWKYNMSRWGKKISEIVIVKKFAKTQWLTILNSQEILYFLSGIRMHFEIFLFRFHCLGLQRRCKRGNIPPKSPEKWMFAF